jgi:hypothetical protein
LILAPPPARPGDALEPYLDRVSASPVTAYLELHASERDKLPDAVRIVIKRGETDVAIVPARVTGDGGLAIARAIVPTGELPPGGYVAYAEVVAGGRVIARVPRPFSIPERR